MRNAQSLVAAARCQGWRLKGADVRIVLPACIATIVVLIAVFRLGIWVVGPHHPSDAKLLNDFQAHKADFDALARLLTTYDQFYDVALDSGDATSGSCRLRTGGELTSAEDARCSQLVQVLSNLGASSAYALTPSIRLTVSAEGTIFSGSSKGYYYAASPGSLPMPDEIVANADHPDWKNHHIVYRHIEGNWYIYYEHDS